VVVSIIKLRSITGFNGGSVAEPSRSSLLSAGSLISIEPGLWGSLPSTGSTVPNLASAQCVALVGAASDVLTFTQTMTSTEGVVELSAKGGLHVIAKQQAGQTSGRLASIGMSSGLRSYLAANTTNDIYISWWGKRTRVGLTGAPLRYVTRIAGTATAQITAGLVIHPTVASTSSISSSADPSDARRLGFSRSAVSDRHFVAVGSTSVSGDFAGTVNTNVFSHGIITDTDKAISPSYLTWAIYVENLTVSGRTFAQVEAIDRALYDLMVNADGGRYYNDTYTDPTTV
jgi:hypothetical protein